MHTNRFTRNTFRACALLIAMSLCAGAATAAERSLTAPATDVPQCPDQGPIVVEPCAVDETLILFDQPVYDDDGLFVVYREGAVLRSIRPRARRRQAGSGQNHDAEDAW